MLCWQHNGSLKAYVFELVGSFLEGTVMAPNQRDTEKTKRTLAPTSSCPFARTTAGIYTGCRVHCSLHISDKFILWCMMHLQHFFSTFFAAYIGKRLSCPASCTNSCDSPCEQTVGSRRQCAPCPVRAPSIQRHNYSFNTTVISLIKYACIVGGNK